MSIKLKYEYGADLHGFYWAESPSKRIEYFRAKKAHPAVAEAIYQCNPGALEGDIFREEDFRYYSPPGHLMAGIDSNLDFVQVSDMLVQSWDTAFSDSKDANWSVCTTGMLVPCKSNHGIVDSLEELTGEKFEDNHYDIYILDVLREKLEFGDLVLAAIQQYRKWRPSIVLIEKKAAGQPLISTLTNQHSIPVIPRDPGLMNKRSRAIHGVKAGSAQGWMQQHRVFFPKQSLWLEDFKKELKNFSGNPGETDDQVDSFVQLCNFSIEQGSDVAMLPKDENVLNYKDRQGTLNPLEELGKLPGIDNRPIICQYCIYFDKNKNWCNFHQLSTTALDTCENYDDGSIDNFY